MLSDEPTAVTKEREWVLIAKFRIRDTPDPAYDVAACERMADGLGRSIWSVLTGIAPVHDVEVETISPNEP